MKKIDVFDNATIAKNSAIVGIVNLENEGLVPLYNDTGAAILIPLTVQFGHVGGTITLTAAWSLNGTNWVSQAFAGTGDVSSIVSATGTGWDNLLIPAIASQVKITCTEDNVAACTLFDLVVGIPSVEE